tara:strand:+ start:121 stop:252 length:132 start_codon:yes stop_codon:yes gene_type:complete
MAAVTEQPSAASTFVQMLSIRELLAPTRADEQFRSSAHQNQTE